MLILLLSLLAPEPSLSSVPCRLSWADGRAAEMNVDSSEKCAAKCRERSHLRPGVKHDCLFRGKLVKEEGEAPGRTALCFGLEREPEGAVFEAELSRAACLGRCEREGKGRKNFICSWDRREALVNRTGKPARACATWYEQGGQHLLLNYRQLPITETDCKAWCLAGSDMKMPGALCTFDGKTIEKTGYERGFCQFQYQQGQTRSDRMMGSDVDKNDCRYWCETQDIVPEVTFRCILAGKVILEGLEPKVNVADLGLCEIVRRKAGKVVQHTKDQLTKRVCTSHCKEWVETTQYWAATCEWKGERLLTYTPGAGK